MENSAAAYEVLFSKPLIFDYFVNECVRRSMA